MAGVGVSKGFERAREAVALWRNDWLRIRAGLAGVWSNDWQADPLDLGLAFVQAPAGVVRVGDVALYSTRVINPERRVAWIEFIADIYAVDRREGFDEAHISQAGYCRAVVPCSGAVARDVEFAFDWCDRCELRLQGAGGRVVPMTRNAGTAAPTPGLWRLSLLLRDPESGRDWHRLEVVQRVAGRAA